MQCGVCVLCAWWCLVCCVCLLVCVCWCVCVLVYVLRVCGRCAFCVLVLWCAVSVSLCGVGVQCVVCGVWCVLCVCGVVCVVCVWRGLARGKPHVCRFKTSPCVGSKTPPCVPAKRAHVFNMRAFCRYTRRRFEPTHGDVLNLQGASLSLSLLSFSLSLVLSSFSLPSFSSFVLFSFSFSALFSLVFPLNNDDNDHSSSRLSLSENTALTCLSVRERGPWPIPFWPNMFASCKKQLSWHNCANLVPLGMNGPASVLEMGDVFVCVSMCQCVFVCVSVC